MTVGITELPPEGMQLGGVALAGDAERGTKTTEGLSLLFTTAGITVQGPQPQIERLLVWSGLDSASCHEKVVLPDGRNAAVMELTSGGQSIRFLFPTETVTPGQAAYLDQALPHWLARYKGAQPAPVATNGSGSGPAAPSDAVGSPTNGSVLPPPATTEPHPAMAPAAAAAAAAAGAAGAAGASYVDQAPPPPPAPGPPPPPPPPATAYGAAPGDTTAPAGYPPPPPPPPPETAGGAGWMTSPDQPADSAAWTSAPAGPPGDAVVAPPVKKRSRGRKGAAPEAAMTASSVAASPGELPPFEPPTAPVPLAHTTLPPPPPDAPGSPTAVGPVIWKPPVDPVTGEAQWDGQPGVTAPPPASPAPPARGRAKRKAKKADKAAQAAAVGTAAAVSTAAVAGTEAATFASPLDSPPAPAGAVAPGAPGPVTAPFDTAPGPPPPPDPDAATGTAAPPDKPRGRKNRLLIFLFVAFLVVVAGIAYFVVKKLNNSSTTATSVPGLSAHAADAALAASINLRQNDLPVGWIPSTSAAQPARPPVAPVAAQGQASRALAQCLGVPVATVTGLFSGSVLPGQTGSATSPVFQNPADPTVRMYSTTRVMTTAAQAMSLTTPFVGASFVSCYAAYQSSLVSAAVPGATAQVLTVPLSAPTGVQSFGYLTTLTIPNQGSEVIGQAFIVGGRIESTLEPTTGGVPVPSTAFTPAYNAVAGRVALAVNK